MINPDELEEPVPPLSHLLFDKVTALSIESLAKTSSGKLIAMISSDLFAVERTFTFAPLIIVSPVCNLYI